jgi:hypothetical protein
LEIQWAAIVAAHQFVGQKPKSLILEPPVGLEPTTYGLPEQLLLKS